MSDDKCTSRRGRNALVFCLVAVVWLAFDMLTKSWFAANFAVGETTEGSILGLICFHLVHNTGAAWGMFGNSTIALGILSLVVCAVLVVYLFFVAPRSGVVEVIGLGLVVAGGLGNAIDRFTLGFVVDFIEPVFIDFPVFNIADVGVTCGFVLFILGLLLRERHESAQARSEAVSGDGHDAQ